MDTPPDPVPSDTTPLISIAGVCKRFGERQILDHVDLTLASGRIVTLIGPNGAGKTTLVRIVLGLLDADAGTISRKPNLRIGYMPQRISLQPTLPITVQRFLQLRQPVDHASIAPTLELLGIRHLQEQAMSAISGGELQRVLLARALLGKPQLLVLDEPAQGVDLAGQAELYQLIDDISEQEHCGVLMISHDLHLVMSATDEVICLNHHICCHGKPEQVSNDPAYLDLFGASAAANLAVYTHHHNHKHDLTGKVEQSSSDADAGNHHD